MVLIRRNTTIGVLPYERTWKCSRTSSTVPLTIGQGRLYPCLISEVTTSDLWLSFTPLSNYIAVACRIIYLRNSCSLLFHVASKAYGGLIDSRISRHEQTSTHAAGVIVQLPKKHSASLVRHILNTFSRTTWRLFYAASCFLFSFMAGINSDKVKLPDSKTFRIWI